MYCWGWNGRAKCEDQIWRSRLYNFRLIAKTWTNFFFFDYLPAIVLVLLSWADVRFWCVLLMWRNEIYCSYNGNQRVSVDGMFSEEYWKQIFRLPVADLCPPSKQNKCGYTCDSICHSWRAATYECVHGSDSECCLTCGQTITKCSSGQVLRDENTCCSPQDCTCLLPNGNILAVRKFFRWLDSPVILIHFILRLSTRLLRKIRAGDKAAGWAQCYAVRLLGSKRLC